jgi:hypothetical protein
VRCDDRGNLRVGGAHALARGWISSRTGARRSRSTSRS